MFFSSRIWSSLTHFTNLKGPVPTGLRTNSLGFFRKAVGLMMSAKSMPRLARKGASTRFSLKTTVCSSVASMESTVLSISIDTQYSGGRSWVGISQALPENLSLGSFIWRPREKTTASALKGVPS